ncbi:MAG: hypothetical protein NVS3B10_22280 [Polyangiales bacterium]
MRVALVVNAHARKFVARPARIDAVRALARGRASVHVTRSRAELESAALAMRDEGAEVVLLCGGDGSYGAGATAIACAWGGAPLPILGLAPGGTVGTVARSLGVAPATRTFGGTVEGIDRVLDRALDRALGSGAVLETATLRVAADELPSRLGFIFGTGLVASFFRRYDPRLDDEAPSVGTGLPGAAAIVARVFVESFWGGAYARSVLDPLRCDVDVERGEPGKTSVERLPWAASSLVVASVLRDLGLGMRVTHRAGERADRLHVVVSGLAPRQLGPRMPRVLRGRSIGDPGEPHFDDLVAALTVEFPDRAGPFVLDGDVHHARRVGVALGPTLRILAPTPRDP